MTVGELLHRISSRELTEWQAYFLLEAEDRQADDLARQSAAGVEAMRD